MTLPTKNIVKITPRLKPEPNRSESATGTNVQNFIRLGQKWAFDVSVGRMSLDDAIEWIELENGAPVSIPLSILQPSNVMSSQGTPVVKGAGQTGAFLLIDGAENAPIRKGQWISVSFGADERDVYRVTGEAAQVGGEHTIPVSPILRRSPADNASVELIAPSAYGLARFSGLPYDVGGVAPFQFSFEELR